jgi:predicted helicase
MCNELCAELKKDLRALRIVKEADLACCTYYHLRQFLSDKEMQSKNELWRVLAQRHVPKTGRYIDLLIFEGTRPRIAIELKWKRASMPKKDRKSLMEALSKKAVHNRGYFITTLIGDKNYSKSSKKTIKHLPLHELPISLRLTKPSQDNWAKTREQLRMR